jgi:hypothetical protein
VQQGQVLVLHLGHLRSILEIRSGRKIIHAQN